MDAAENHRLRADNEPSLLGSGSALTLHLVAYKYVKYKVGTTHVSSVVGLLRRKLC